MANDDSSDRGDARRALDSSGRCMDSLPQSLGWGSNKNANDTQADIY